MADTLEKDVMAYDEAYYLDVQPEKGAEATAQNELMNVGFTSMEESTNPTEVSVQYIGDKSKTNKVTGYASISSVVGVSKTLKVPSSDTPTFLVTVVFITTSLFTIFISCNNSSPTPLQYLNGSESSKR